MTAIVLNLKPFIEFTDQQFYQLCQEHQGLKFERTAEGELVIVSPVGGESGSREADLIGDLVYWNRQTQLGKVFSSSTCFKLPLGGNRSPDVAWISLPRWQQLTWEQQKTFPPLCPDFLIELRSESDSIAILKLKMEEYIDNGLRLGWLIDPQNHCVAIYRPGQDPQWLDHPQIINGETILPGFTFMVSKLWS